MTINYKQCPNCKSKNVSKIVYGYPSQELIMEAESGKVKLGGCCISENNPDYCCNECQYEWNKGQAIDAAYSKIKVLKASVGGYLDGYFYAEIDLENHKTTWSLYHHEEEEIKKKSIRKSTAERFINQLKMVNLLNWKSKYIEPGVLDGTHWSLEIITNEKKSRNLGTINFLMNGICFAQ